MTDIIARREYYITPAVYMLSIVDECRTSRRLQVWLVCCHVNTILYANNITVIADATVRCISIGIVTSLRHYRVVVIGVKLVTGW